ncbi:hypothetical protein I549_3819 [Mycobacterium avium subsp. avium 2285 (R)]|nr:hypothetical protein I549_3819 [Mycobacterium avium subsp. avium 2285 (R)]
MRDLVTAHQPDAVVHLAAVVSPLSYRKPDLAGESTSAAPRTCWPPARRCPARPCS